MLDFSMEKSHDCCLKYPCFFHKFVVLRLEQGFFSAVMVVSTLPWKTFFAIDSLVEIFTAIEIPASISPDPECFCKMPEKKIRPDNLENQTADARPEFRKNQTKKI